MENLTLDFNNFGSRVGLGTYEKCDSLTLTIMLDEKDYTGYKFKILAKKSDGHIIEQDIKEQDINREEKTIKTELNNQFTTKEGLVKLEINMIKEGKEDTTKEAFFIVRDTINGEVVESTSIIPTLEGVKVFIDEAVSSLGDLEQAGEDIALINGEFKEAEIKRKSSELLRERSEKERVRLESIRTTEEADRIKAEAERKEAENNRKVAESNRKLNENTRKTNEAARVEAELNRQNTFEENEEIRNENEKLRIEAEKERKLTFSNNNRYESERVEAEKLRVIAEDKRVTSEKVRAKAEEERIKAETRREGTYTDFNDSEVERKNNEANRVRAEAERVNAESGRNELFNSNEEKRNNTFVESERARERAFNEAQTNRSEAYEESERVREEAFKVSEAARNEAEEVRKETELLRVETENNREVAESKRVKVESSRVEAEKLRVTAETGRVEAENLRVTAEEERVAAEQIREEKFEGFESKIDKNTKELKGARTATTGEEFDTLDERIDCEVDRLNKKIEVSMLQQEDKESHMIENTVEGMTTDMIIKGNTLKNLSILPNKEYTTNTNIYYTLGKNNFKPSTKYMLICDVKDSEEINVIDKTAYLRVDNYDGNVLGGYLGVVGTHFMRIYFEFTTPLEFNGDFLLRQRMAIGTQQTIKDIVILEFNEIYHNIPYFEGIKSFGQQEDKISNLSHNKNLLELKQEYFVGGNVGTLENNVVKINYSSPFEIMLNRNNPIKLKRGTVSFSFKTKVIQGDGIGFKVTEYGNTSNILFQKVYGGSITIDKDIDIAIYIVRNGTQGKAEMSDIQIENGVSSSYEPYKCDKKDILLSELGFDEGLRGLPSVQDELNDIKNVAIKRIGKHIFTGNENIRQLENNTKALIVLIENIKGVDSKYFISNSNIGYEFRWNVNEWENNYPIAFNFKDSSAGSMSLLISKSKIPSITDIDSLKQYLKENNIELYYQLKEPIETPLDESIALKVYNEKTYISFENAISGTSSFKAPVNTVATIARLNRENIALEEKNVKLKKGTYINTKDISITKEELQATQSAVDFLLFNNLNAVETAMLYNGKKEGGGSMGAYLAMRIIKGKLKYDAVMKQYGEFKEDIDLILEAEGYGHLITQQ